MLRRICLKNNTQCRHARAVFSSSSNCTVPIFLGLQKWQKGDGFLGSEAGTFPPIRNVGSYRSRVNTLLGQSGDFPASRPSGRPTAPWEAEGDMISCRREISGHSGPPWSASAAPPVQAGAPRKFAGLGLRRSKSKRSRIPAFSPTCRPSRFRFPEHDWNKESLSSNSFRAVGRRPDKFALSDPVEADAATCGLRAIGAVVVQLEAGSARSI